MSSSTTSADFDLPPVTPTLPVNPKIEDYERASEYERCKLAQIKRTFEQLKAEYSHLDDACNNAMAGQGQNSVEKHGDVVAKKESQAPRTPSHSKSPSLENTPAAGPASTGQHVRRKSSLNASAPAFMPGSLGGGGGGGYYKASPKSA